jgi:hypothetical protein
MSDNQKYMTRRIFKDGSKPRIVEENLTEKEAQAIVQEDMKTNPDCDYYMLVYTKMK